MCVSVSFAFIKALFCGRHLYRSHLLQNITSWANVNKPFKMNLNGWGGEQQTPTINLSITHFYYNVRNVCMSCDWLYNTNAHTNDSHTHTHTHREWATVNFFQLCQMPAWHSLYERCWFGLSIIPLCFRFITKSWVACLAPLLEWYCYLDAFTESAIQSERKEKHNECNRMNLFRRRLNWKISNKFFYHKTILTWRFYKHTFFSSLIYSIAFALWGTHKFELANDNILILKSSSLIF